MKDIGRRPHFLHTSLRSMPPLGGPRRNIAIPFGVEKLEWCGNPLVKKYEDMFSRLDGIAACDGQTDRRTDGLCIGSRGNN